MIRKKKYINILAAITVAIILLTPFARTDWRAFAATTATKNLEAGSTWVVDKTTMLTGLTIAEVASIAAPEGYNLTLTIDGVETGIKPGTYKGDIVLTVTKDIVINYVDMGTTRTYHFRTAIDVNDGKYMPESSVVAAVSGGKVTDVSARDIKITSNGENFNGIVVRGDAKASYSIINPVIKLTGNGGNDFAGFGSAIMTEGNADVTVNNATIINHGVIRAAVVVRGHSTIHVNDSSIETYNGTLPEKIVGMMSVPWVLGLTGNVRSTNIIENGTAYYNNTRLKAQGWGVLSTDDVKSVRLYAAKCTIETVESGYGSYSIGECINTFSGCTFNVNDYALIIANRTASGVLTDGTVVNSGRFGVMVHASNYGTLTIDKGTVLNTKKAAIQIKTAYPTIVVDNAKLNSANGIILQAIVNDDPNMPEGGGTGAPPGAGGAGGPGGTPAGPGMTAGPGGQAQPAAAPGPTGGASGGAPGSGAQGGAPAPGMPGSAAGGASSSRNTVTKTEINATFRDVILNGDIINSMTSKGDVVVIFEKATITGAITTATQAVESEKPSKDKYYLIGEIKHTYCATDNKYGVKVSLDGKSAWTVSKTSYLNSLTIADGASIAAPKGQKVTMTVDGIETAIKAGGYKGKIVLAVN